MVSLGAILWMMEGKDGLPEYNADAVLPLLLLLRVKQQAMPPPGRSSPQGGFSLLAAIAGD